MTRGSGVVGSVGVHAVDMKTGALHAHAQSGSVSQSNRKQLVKGKTASAPPQKDKTSTSMSTASAFRRVTQDAGGARRKSEEIL